MQKDNAQSQVKATAGKEERPGSVSAENAQRMNDLVAENSKLMSEIQRLRKTLSQVVFADEISLVEPGEVEGENGVPVPADFLRYLVAGTDHLQWFIASGKLGAQTLVDALAKERRPLGSFNRILDFGCGCGRVLRHLRGLTKAEIWGTDSNPRAIQWCDKYLDFARFKVNLLEPPLPFQDGAFDLVYAFSVFTHLPEPLQARWMDEMHRILAPGGYLIVSFHGDKCVEGLSPADRASYDKGHLVVCEPDVVGTNYCMAFHPESYVRGILAQSFDIADFIQEGAKGNPPQDLYVMRPRAKKAF